MMQPGDQIELAKHLVDIITLGVAVPMHAPVRLYAQLDYIISQLALV